MIPITYRKNIEIENEFYTMVVKNRSKQFIDDIDNKCKRYFSKTFKQIVCAEPKTLNDLKKDIKSRSNYNQIIKDFKQINSQELNNYIVKMLYKGLSQEAKQLIYDQVGLKVCPYCNRNFIEKLNINENNEERRVAGTWELDHFYPKESFPMFAVSFYNLIPVCGVCNGIKNSQDFKQNPYMIDSADGIFFDYDILGEDYLNDENQLEIRILASNQAALDDADKLHLTEIYNGHKDIVQEIIKKTRYYNPEYIENLASRGNNLFEGKEEIYRMLYGGYMNPDEFGRRPLSKFIKDIYRGTIELIDGFDSFADCEND